MDSHGYGYGYATEYGRERQLRTAVISTVHGSIGETPRDIIGRAFDL